MAHECGYFTRTGDFSPFGDMTTIPSRHQNYRARQIQIGFPQGISNPEVLARQRAYQRAYRKTNRKKDNESQARYYRKNLLLSPGVSAKMAKLIAVARNTQIRNEKRKAQAHEARKKVLQLQKLWPQIHNRRYHIISGYALTDNHALIQRRDDLQMVSKERRAPSKSSHPSITASRV